MLVWYLVGGPTNLGSSYFQSRRKTCVIKYAIGLGFRYSFVFSDSGHLDFVLGLISVVYSGIRFRV